ncbi:M61 family metallopeptidase [Hydrogenophaga pseudoflava]|uniref:M61 glycyl aminopeptidase n=1 Tax=Hydrogenophaga pseudoflava TaxID=47421 RepID=A0A4P6X063_HYDPS|nr:M61 family metallopeptidase [Hydrogenophaga pseudoflava]QBM26894.1 M61 glycyl aminopeptidase [Hydrogenophaga pseudoflava]
MSRNKPTTPALHYRVEPLNHRAHLFAVTLDITRPARSQKLTLPVWIPGSYLVREFSQHLQHLSATQGGEALAVKQLDKHRWQVDNDGQRTLSLRWEVYAFDASVRTAFLDATRGFFNATSLCLMVAGREDEPHAIEIQPGDAPAGWQVATGLSPVKANEQGFGTYLAQNYDELADCPVEMGTFWSGEFSACGVPHRFVVSGAGGWFDGQRLLDDTRRICEAQIRFWHGDGQPPYERYVFMLHASGEGYGGLEHRNSTALIAQRTDLPKISAKDAKPAALKATDGYTTLLGLISHEYFHTWNVKRLRPAEFKRYDYTRENHTELLWFFEGFTSYYDDLFLRRAGLIDDATYLQLVTKTINQVQQSPGQRVQSVAQASFDAWTRYYRVGENTPNATISYYTKGALVAMCLDLTLRAEGRGSLDEVMRALWHRTQGGPMRESDLSTVLRQLGKRSFAAELAQWVHGTADLPVLDLLAAAGAKVHRDKAPLAQSLGLRVAADSSGLTVKNVLRGGAGEAAGLAAGDEWLGVEFAPARRGLPAEAWRVRKLDEVAALRGTRSALTALVSRDGRLLRCSLTWPADDTAVRLTVEDAARLGDWLTRCSTG